jgi:hypothetical protein
MSGVWWLSQRDRPHSCCDLLARQNGSPGDVVRRLEREEAIRPVVAGREFV